MRDDLSDFMPSRAPSPARPLFGLTLLVVEDSRFASEAVRLMCLRSGARFRRADCLASAERHLQVWRPAAALVDLGLPDGSGLDLIARMAAQPQTAPVILATSGDPTLEQAARAVGADGFLPKPVESLRAFQSAILRAFPRGVPAPDGGGAEDRVDPDRLALRDDLALVAGMLGQGPDPALRRYLARFLGGIALGSHDDALAAAAEDLARDGAADASLGRVRTLVQARLAENAAF